MKKLLFLVLAVLCLALAVGCGGTKEPAAQKVLKVGMDATFPPFEYYQQNADAYTGFDVELMNGVAANMGYDKVEFVNTPLPDLIAGLNSGKYDVIASGFSMSRARAEQVDFTEPYLHDGFRIAVAANSDLAGDNISALAGKKVAVKSSSFAQYMVEAYGAAGEIVYVPDIEDALKAITDGKADCAVISKSAGSFFIANGYGDKIKFAGGDLRSDNIALAVKKGDKEFLDKLNNGLRDFRKSQDFDRLKKTYFGDM